MEFEWDPSKERENRAKHSLSFDEAAELFRSGVDYLEIYDVEHSAHEDRFICIGPIDRGVVVVVITEREGAPMRLISARFASKREQDLFAERLRV